MGTAALGKIETRALDKFFKLFKPQFVLGTTFPISLAFFESAVWPRIDRSRLKRCLLLCDRSMYGRVLQEGTAILGAGRDYWVSPVSARRLFHPKVWLMGDEDRLALLVGSGNLTQSGFIDNVEMFDVADLHSGDSGRILVEDIERFLAGLLGLFGADGGDLPKVVRELVEIRDSVSEFKSTLSESGSKDLRLLSSFDGSFATQLAGLCKTERLLVASPYFGRSVGGLRMLKKELSPKELTVFPAVNREGAIDIAPAKLEKFTGSAVPGLKLSRGQRSKRFAHLKLYGLSGKGRNNWLFTGSVNCTEAGVGAKNVEAGLLRRVSASTLKSYFEESKKDFSPSEAGTADYPEATTSMSLWANDYGTELELLLGEDERKKLPLSNLVIKVRVGAKVDELKVKEAFNDGLKFRIPWGDLPEVSGDTASSRVLEFSAVAVDGADVSGACLIDDFETLRADPGKRGALRAMACLQNAAGLPEFSDLAALFRLIEDGGFYFSGGAGVDDDGSEWVGNGYEYDEEYEDEEEEVIPVWPPQPMDSDFSVSTGGRTSSVYWFNKILGGLISRRKDTQVHVGTASGFPENEAVQGDKARVGEAESPPVSDHDVTICEQMWQAAEYVYERKKDELNSCMPCMPTEDSPGSLWIFEPWSFLFLARLCLLKATKRVAPGAVAEETLDVVNGYLAGLFSERNQGRDYWPDQPVRKEYKSSLFPPLALDLAENCDTQAHSDFALIILLAFAHKYACHKQAEESMDELLLCTGRKFSSTQWLFFRYVITEGALADLLNNREHMEDLWRRYFMIEEDGLSWDDIKKALVDLKSETIKKHPSYLGVQSCQKWLAEKKLEPENFPQGLESVRHLFMFGQISNWLRVNYLTEHCPNEDCSHYSEPNKRPAFVELHKFQPGVCERCRTLLIPDLIFKILSPSKE